MDRNERQKQLETLIRQHPDWGYVRLNKELKKDTGGGYRKQTLLDIKRKIVRKSAPTPTAESRTKLIRLFTAPKPNQLVRELRSLGFKDFEIAEALATKRHIKNKDGSITTIDTTPPPPEGSTFENMINARLRLLQGKKPQDWDNVIVESYTDNGWTKDDDTLDFWKMFRQFFRDSDSPLIVRSKATGIIKFSKGNVAEQKRRYRERQRAMHETVKPTTKGTPVYDTKGNIVYYQHPIPKRNN